MTRGGGSDERQRQEPCVKWTVRQVDERWRHNKRRRRRTERGCNNQLAGQTRGKDADRHVAVVRQESRHGQSEASGRQTMTTRVDKYSNPGERAAQQKSFQGECGGGVERGRL